MSRWIEIPGGRAVMAASQQGDVIGYGCRRPAVGPVADQHLIGPLYANSYDIARDLVYCLTSDIIGQNISMNIWYFTYCQDTRFADNIISLYIRFRLRRSLKLEFHLV